MAKYYDKKNLKLIGERLKMHRIRANYSRSALSELTDFDVNTIRNIETGNEFTISYFLHICFALNITPSKILDNLTPSKPINSKSKRILASKSITKGIHDLIKQGFLNDYQKTKNISEKMLEEFQLKVDSRTLSSILIRLANDSILKVKKEGRLNTYKKMV